MRWKVIATIVLAASALSAQSAQQAPRTPLDPLLQITKTFPDSIKVKNNGHLLEFCPDGTCDGFVASTDVPLATMKDFAYLYVYYFSDFVYLPDWRNQNEAKDAAESVLAKPAYLNCTQESSRERARCVLLNLSRNGRIKLIFVRYDEGHRGVVPENINDHLKDPPPASTP